MVGVALAWSFNGSALQGGTVRGLMTGTDLAGATTSKLLPIVIGSQKRG
ncbi:hypothetical protein [Pantanalinema sp. GBBB05]